MPAALKFDENVAREICDRMAEGETLTAICKTQGMPGYRVVRRWREETGNTIGDQTFEAAFRQSREDQCHRWADEIVDESQVEVVVTPFNQLVTSAPASGVSVRGILGKGLASLFAPQVAKFLSLTWLASSSVSPRRSRVPVMDSDATQLGI